MSDLTIPRGSREYVTATVTADVPLTSSTPVKISLTHRGQEHAWLDATWTGAEATTRQCRTLFPVDFSGTALPKTSYSVFVQITDTSEVPIILAGSIKLT